jgi:TolB protein
VDGSDVRRITQYDEVAGSPRWSADGSKLVFYHATRDESSNIASPLLQRGTTHIVSHDLASGERRVLTNTTGEKRSPQWLRDGRIGYESDGPEGGIEFVGGTPGARGQFKNPTWSADGKRMLFHRDVDRSWPPHRSWRSRDPQFQLMRTGVFSNWSPAGDRMISNDRTAGILHNSILVMNPDGSERSTIFTDPDRSALAPVWSPQGDRIAFALGRFFQMTQGAAQADIASIGIDGKGLHVHTNGSSNYGFPSWSRDGRRIVYREASKARNALHIVNLEDGRSRVLITGPAHYNFPGWSPKGDVIAFTSDMDGDYEIYTIRADGAGLKRQGRGTAVPGESAGVRRDLRDARRRLRRARTDRRSVRRSDAGLAALGTVIGRRPTIYLSRSPRRAELRCRSSSKPARFRAGSP